MTTPHKILRIDASARYQGSISRQLTDELISQLQSRYPSIEVIQRDLAQGVPFVNEAMVTAYNTPDEDRTAEQREVLQPSHELVSELMAADSLIIGTPIYNFSVPASLKAYIDLVCRARLTFSYSSEGPKGLLHDRPVYLIVTSGGTPVGSHMDYATGYLKQVLGFIGLHSVEIIAADGLNQSAGTEKVEEAQAKMRSLLVANV